MPEVPPVITATFPSCLPMTELLVGAERPPPVIMMMGDIFGFGRCRTMRLTKDQATDNRRRMIVAAARPLAEQGIAPAAEPHLLKAAGPTHRGFSTHFR